MPDTESSHSGAMSSGVKQQQGILVVIGGPTASGKTAAAVHLAKHYGAEIVSADARQFYRALRIGAAIPTEAEMNGVPHHFVGHLDIAEAMSAGAFERAAVPLIEELLTAKGIALLVGGSGLYIDAVLNGLDQMPTGNIRIRTELQKRFREHGLDPLLARLTELDPATVERIDLRNPHRVIRALEVSLATGRPYSAQRMGRSKERPWRTVRIAMDLPRTELYARIDARFDAMITAGLVEEARNAYPQRAENALQTVGYKELFAHFDGALTLEDAIALAKQHTRNFAKRQMTWLRRDADWHGMAPDDVAGVVAVVDAAASAS
ncbi:MAG: tRNA (adenosine(37)-N6)-dimethylallyltransferase MiaA [Flavobacteriales bacterium]